MENWTKYDSVAKCIIQNNKPSSHNASKMLSDFVSNITKIKTNKAHYFGLVNYCNDVINFYKKSSVKAEFYKTYNEEYDLFKDEERQNHLGKWSANLINERAILQKIHSLEKDIDGRTGEPSSVIN